MYILNYTLLLHECMDLPSGELLSDLHALMRLSSDPNVLLEKVGAASKTALRTWSFST